MISVWKCSINGLTTHSNLAGNDTFFRFQFLIHFSLFFSEMAEDHKIVTLISKDHIVGDLINVCLVAHHVPHNWSCFYQTHLIGKIAFI